jgi:hypothetical protein
MPNPADFPQALSAHPAFNLAGNPFEAIVYVAGQPIRYRYAGSGPLKPHECEEHLPLYFDVYEWMNATRLKGLGADGRLTVLQRPNDDRSMVILISGFRGSGRTSALNLLKYETRKRSAIAPVVVEYNAKITSNVNQHCKEIAFAIRLAIKRAGHDTLAMQLADSQKDWADTVGQDAGSPEMLFDIFKENITDLLPGLPVVVALEAQDHKSTSDIWRPICRMLSRLCQYIIVTLTDRDQAEHFRGSLEIGAFQTAWIDAPKVTQGKIVQILSSRLAIKRVNPPATPGLEPFTQQALQVLFQPIGAGAAPVTMPIAVAMSMLAAVFQRKAQALEQDIANGIQLTEAKVLITGQDMGDYLANL